MTNALRNLAVRIKRSDPEAFRALFDLYQQSIYNFIYLKLRDSAAAEDVVQEAFIRVWENRLELDENRSVRTYLFTIANNLALNVIRHQRIVLKYQAEADKKPPVVDETYLELESRELQIALVKALMNLPEAPRQAFMMSRFEELKYKEIADRLGISVKTVENHIGKALKLLRKSLITDEERASIG
ncbi:RNA polymerase sigma-70 factor [bacterium]|nr:RNA polymerase sigma-70 factor [bacterium]